MLVAAALIAAGCGSGRTSVRSPRRDGLESIFEATPQLLAAPATTLDQLRRLGVDRVRVTVPWDAIAPNPGSSAPPGGFEASSPSAYAAAGWAPYDAIVRDATARGIGVYLNPSGPAPQWATSPGEVQPGPPGVWEPSVSQFGFFMQALAKRYTGSYIPPGASAPLPRVSFWSIWNEPNYGVDLAPQAIDDSTVEVSPRLYRGLLDAAWQALGATGHGSDTILIGELAPRGITVGDNPGNYSGMVPLRFLRALYCVSSSFRELSGASAAARGCPVGASGSAAFAKDHPALFKASGFAVHPYPDGGLPPDIRTPDEPDYADLASLPELERTLDHLQSVYGSRKRFPIYSTEFGYQTDPPEHIAKSATPRVAAYYMNWAEYMSWRDPRVRSFDQYQLIDSPAGNFASGLEFADGAPKPNFYAYQMPIFLPISSAPRSGALEVWGCVRPARYARLQTARAQTVQIQFRPIGGGFRTLRLLSLTDPYGYFDLPMTFRSSGSVRLAWSYPGGPTIHSRTVAVTVH